jgi:hypothetical protein
VIEYLRWQVRLVLVRWRETAKWEKFTAGQQAYNAFVSRKRVIAFLDRVSPFEYGVGYHRVWIRRLAAKVVTPHRSYVSRFWRVTFAILDRLAPYTGPGKYEGMDADRQLMTEWLDSNSEWASHTTGDLDWGLVAQLFELTPPWSNDEPEFWIVTTDYRGFVDGIRFLDGQIAHEEFEHIAERYNDDMAPEHEHEGEEFELNREGMPEFNGAFGDINKASYNVFGADGGRNDR